MKRYLSYILSAFIHTSVFAQNYYAVSQRDAPLINETFVLNLSNCDSTLVYTCLPTNNTIQIAENQYSDITMDSATVYYVSGFGSLYRSNINDSTSCQYLGNFNYNINALASNPQGAIYACGQVNGVCSLFKYESGNFSLIGNLPSNFFSAGDLFFYENRLFLTGSNSNLTNGYIVELDVVDPSQSCYYMTLPNMQPWAAFSIQSGNTSRAFVVDAQNTTGGKSSSLYEVDMGTKTLGAQLCSYPFLINGAAAPYNFTNAGNAHCSFAPAAIKNVKGFTDYFYVQNPVKQSIVIESNLDPSQVSRVEVFDISGHTMISMAGTGVQFNIPSCGLASGVYILSLVTKGGIKYTQKLIKQAD